ncbi:MAG TPA: sulfatase-like hydrolase/transferase [Phycisphaerae bacterium]|nr:sulfatase-like hydrolase/transferase [Phycisphaerae bacterium]
MRAILIGLSTLLTIPAPAADRPPNVIVFYADDLGNGDVGCYGAKDVQTPGIDALAASGVRFTNYYAPAPICAPSRAALLTGRYPSRCGMSSTRNVPSDLGTAGMPGREATFAEIAKTKGYATAVFGKWHLGSTDDTVPNTQGFDLFVGHHSSCVDSFSHMYYASEPWFHDLFRNRREIFIDGEHLCDIVTRETLKFIDEHKGSPFLLYVSYNQPHYPMVAKAKFIEMYKHLPRDRQFWAALVSMMDDSIGQIMQHLKERNLSDNTLVFLASDNGAPNASKRGEGGGRNTPYREYKRSLFDGGHRVPGIVSWPGTIPTGQTRDQLTIGMDVFSTILDAIGAEPPEDRVIDGMSWMPLLKDAGRPGHETLFFEWDEQHALRQSQWKLVINGLIDMETSRQNRAEKGSPDHVFLADAAKDPGEQTNVAAENKDLVAKLTKLHADWRASIANDPTASPPFDAASANTPPASK